MDKQDSPKVQTEKLFDEFPTIIASDAPDTTADFSKYELDGFSIYKVDDKKPTSQVEEKQLDLNNPDAFIIEGDANKNQNYVDLDFDFKQPTNPANTSSESTENYNLLDEKFDFPELSTSLISQSDNSSFSEILDVSTLNTAPISESTGIPSTIDNSDKSQVDISVLTNFDLSSHMDMSTVLSASGESASSTMNNTRVEAVVPAEEQVFESVKNESSSSLSNILDLNTDNQTISGNFEPDIHFVSDADIEPVNQPLVLDPEEYIPNYGSSVPSTIPEEEIVEVATSFSTFTPEKTYITEAILPEQVTLADSNNDSDADNLIDSTDNKDQSKPVDAFAAESEAIFVATSKQSQSPIPTITEAQTIDVNPQFAEEFVVNRSPVQQFFDESLEKELPPPASKPIEDSVGLPVEAPILEASAPVLSTFALSSQPPLSSQPAPSLDEFANDSPSSPDHFTAAADDSPVGSSNTLPPVSAQVWESSDSDEQQQQQPAPVDYDLKKDQSDSNLVDETVSAVVATSTNTAPVAAASSPSQVQASPPSSPALTTTTTTAFNLSRSSLPPPPAPPTQQQSEHEDIIEPSTTNLLHTSSPNDQQLLSALQEEAEEEEQPPPPPPLEKKTTWSRDNKAEEVVANTPEQSQASSVASTVPNTRPPFSHAPSAAPDTATTSSTMGRKNNQFRRENSNDETEYSGPDRVKDYIQTVLGANVAELVYWRDPKNTGIVFGIGLVILLSLSIFSVISVVAYTLLFTLLGTLSFRVYKNVLQAVQKTSEGHPFKEYLEIEIAPSKDRINEIVEQLVNQGTNFVNRMRSVLLVEDIVDSLKYLLIFWALTYIGAWFNGLTLVILSYIAAFSVPKVYEQNKAQIDQYLDLINSKITEISDKVPFLKKTIAEKKEE